MTTVSKYQESRYLVRYTRVDAVAYFHALRLGVVYISPEVDCQLKAILHQDPSTRAFREADPDNAALLEHLEEQGMLVADAKDDDRQLESLRQQHLGKPQPDIMYLILTDRCNLVCKYCFIEGAMPAAHQYSNMPPELAEKAIDLFVRLSKSGVNEKKKQVIFYGGEPLLNRPTFFRAVDRLRQEVASGELPAELEIHLVTNGTTIDPAIAEFIAQHQIFTSVSLDGPQSINDQMRIYQSGGGTFQAALNGYQLLKTRGVQNAGISCTIGQHNITQIPDILEWYHREFGVDSVGLNLLVETPNAVNQVDQQYTEAVADVLILAFKRLRELGVYEDRMMRKVRAFQNHAVYPFDCGGCGSQFVVAPDGQIGICQAFLGTKKTYAQRDYTTFDPCNEEEFVEWSNRSPLLMEECQNCPAVGFCGGGCPYNAFLKHGSIWALDGRFCVHALKTLEWLIWDLFEQTQKH